MQKEWFRDHIDRWLTWPLWAAVCLGAIGVVAFCGYMIGRIGAESEPQRAVKVTPIEGLPHFREAVVSDHRNRAELFRQKCVIADLLAENARLRAERDEWRHAREQRVLTVVLPQWLPPASLPPELPPGDLIPVPKDPFPVTPVEAP